MDFILSSNFPLEGNENVVEFILKRLKVPEPKTAFISAFNQVDDFEKYRNNLIDYGLHTLEYLEIKKEVDLEGLDYLAKFDILYLHGGDPFRILQQYKTSKFRNYFLDFYKTDKIVISTSGSSMVLSDDISLLYSLYPKSRKKTSNNSTNMTKGLSIFPYVVLPHYNRFLKKDHTETIKKFTMTKKNRVYLLFDGSAIAYSKDSVEIIGNVVIYENGKEVSC